MPKNSHTNPCSGSSDYGLSYRKLLSIFILVWAAAGTAFHLYSSFIGYLEPRSQRSIHLFFLLPLVFLIIPAVKKSDTEGDSYLPGPINILLFLLATLPFAYSYFHADQINLRLEGVDEVTGIELVMGTIATLLVIEALRRAVSPILAGMVIIGISYLFLTEYLPGFLHYRNIGFDEIIETLYLFNGQGIFGSITGIASTMIAVFIAFGAFMEASGTGRLFTNGGQLIAGRYAGGPAKVAVVTSAFFGTLSGSASSNVFTTGSFTIPMMKKIGYRPQVAGGIETAASVGGQSAPPIMGAGAFIMAEMTNIPYSTIIIAAILGSVCYFSLIFITVHLEAKKNGIEGLPVSELPKLSDITRELHLLIPIAILVGLLMMHYSAHTAALYSILATFVVTSFKKESRFTPRKLLEILDKAGRNTAPIAVACVGAGIIVAVLTKTGLIVAMGGLIADVAGGKLWAAAIILMFVTLVMGMGVPTTPAYVITSAIGAPLLINQFGVDVLAAHMFVFYFAILADATPPVSIASYAAASISGANPIVTGLHASRMAIAGYIVGFSYLFVPELRMEGDLLSIAANVAVIIGGLTLLAGSLVGYLGGRLNTLARIPLGVVGLMLALYSDIDAVWRLLVIIILLALCLNPVRARSEQNRLISTS